MAPKRKALKGEQRKDGVIIHPSPEQVEPWIERLPAIEEDLRQRRRKDGLPYQPWEISVPLFVPSKKDKTPTLKASLKQVVTVRGEANATERLRNFFRSQCPEGKDEDEVAADNFAKLKERDLTLAEWDTLGRDCGAWWKNDISATYRKSRQGK